MEAIENEVIPKKDVPSERLLKACAVIMMRYGDAANTQWLRDLMLERDDVIQNKDEELQTSRKEIVSLEKENEELRTSGKRLVSTLAEKSGELRPLEQQLVSLQKENEELKPLGKQLVL